ncbi:YggL family protein [Shewanella sp. KCT]|uniref:YggL 50S ribosome-binding family protein n=1 Tax=Shewanella sp. KCT TaxID=2569535 RepID=UPI001183014E|nr:YggL family protein [Shewanella sp. KCT]TVP14917.1 hypothetical protein AYI87_07985 [Shewanella sp. KCT]
MKINKLENKSKRLRKKLYLGEFATLGFYANCQLDADLGGNFDTFLDDIIAFIESRNLIAGGGGSPEEMNLFLCSNQRYGSATQDDRAALQQWLERHEKVSAAQVGELVDANYQA